MIFPQYLRNLDSLRNEEEGTSALHKKTQKNDEVMFCLAWNIIFTDNYKVLVLNFLDVKNMVFLNQKVDGNMMFTDY